MPHVREGEMHAYLDGALDRLGEDTARRVREHLSTCEDCQALMEQERALRESAAALLDRALPREITPPPFEELRRRALVGESGASQPSDEAAAAATTKPPAPGALRPRRRVSTWTWAWAASLVMALGTGWMIGGGSLDFRDAPQFVLEEAVPEAAVPSTAPAEAPLVSADQTSATEPRDEDAARPAVEPEPEADAATAADDRPAAPSIMPERPEADELQAAPPALRAMARQETPAVDSSERDDEDTRLGRARSQAGRVARDLAGATAGARLDSTTPVPSNVAASAAFEDAPVELLESVASERLLATDGGPMVFESAPVTAVLAVPQTGGRAIMQELPTGDSVLLVWVGESAEREEFAAWLDRALPPEEEEFSARRAPMRELRPADAPAAEMRRANEAFALGRSAPWPTTLRISRGSDLLTVYGTAPEADLRRALVRAGLIPEEG